MVNEEEVTSCQRPINAARPATHPSSVAQPLAIYTSRSCHSKVDIAEEPSIMSPSEIDIKSLPLSVSQAKLATSILCRGLMGRGLHFLRSILHVRTALSRNLEVLYLCNLRKGPRGKCNNFISCALMVRGPHHLSPRKKQPRRRLRGVR